MAKQTSAIKAWPVARAKHVTYEHDGELHTVNSDYSHRLGIGMSHYKKTPAGYLHSYNQVFHTMHSVSRAHAVERAHARIDQHATLPHGTVTPEHNPVGEHSHATVKMNVEYHPSHQAESELPKVDAITGESLEGAEDIYVPHVDDSSRGHCYQELLSRKNGLSHLENTLGTATLENAITLAHAIVDEIVEGKK